ncbi:MAG TPA: hypothetical protein ENK67_04395 [Flavobacteriia bacterium]|jgi:hypothetical protein|nr:hypothetical protein [Flavobacteriia bacterium]
MAIKIFIASIIVISLLFINIKHENKLEEKNNVTTPNVVFYDSIVYEINEKNVKRIIQSKQALNFDTRDELYDATIIQRTKDNLSDSLSAEYIIKKAKVYNMYQNVVISRSNGMQLSSDRLVFDDKSKIVSNDTDFTIKKDNSILVGNNLYLDTIKEQFKAQNTHFVLKDIKP